jgi:hypothetical protein
MPAATLLKARGSSEAPGVWVNGGPRRWGEREEDTRSS